MKPLEELSAKELERLEENAKRLLSIGSLDQRKKAEEMLELISNERCKRSPKKGLSVEGIAWDNSDKSHRFCFLDGELVAEIKQDENHNSENDEVYSVFVEGIRQEERFRYVVDARRAVELKLKS